MGVEIPVEDETNANNASTGIIGWGRFGRALGGLLRRAGVAVSAFDPRASIEDAQAASTVEVLAERSRWILLAVPIPQLRTALRAVRPCLRPHHRVLDVGSVKMRPQEVLREELGTHIPWAATHPLFGPASLARGERPLRVVVCTNTQHPGVVAEAGRWYERLGCEVTLQSAEEHDRKMAFSHALAFFLAKGLLDTGADVEAELIPPSFRALESTIKAVRADAGHLFQAIQRQNPFAAEARQKLLDALAGIHHELAALDRDPQADEAPPRVSIPDLGDRDPLKKPPAVRLDEIDRELVALLARRAELRSRSGPAGARGLTGEAGDAGAESRVRAWADAAGLDPELLGQVFSLLNALPTR